MNHEAVDTSVVVVDGARDQWSPLTPVATVEQRRRVGDVLSHPGGRLVGRW
jgi:hypothetical protein